MPVKYARDSRALAPIGPSMHNIDTLKMGREFGGSRGENCTSCDIKDVVVGSQN